MASASASLAATSSIVYLFFFIDHPFQSARSSTSRACSGLIESGSLSSCPRLSRASTSFLRHLSKQDVDGRTELGHDERQRWFNATGSCSNVVNPKITQEKALLSQLLRACPFRATNFHAHLQPLRAQHVNALPTAKIDTTTPIA